MTQTVPVFDGHNDVLLRLRRSGRPHPYQDFLQGGEAGHIDLPKARQGDWPVDFVPCSFPRQASNLMTTGISRPRPSRKR